MIDKPGLNYGQKNLYIAGPLLSKDLGTAVYHCQRKCDTHRCPGAVREGQEES